MEKEMAAHASILAWETPWTEEPGGLQSTGCRESDMTRQLKGSSMGLAVSVLSAVGS